VKQPSADGNAGSLIPWVAGLLRPYLGSLLLATLLAAVISGCRAGLVFITRDLLDQLLTEGSPYPLWVLPLGVVSLFGIQALARIVRTWLTRRSSLLAEQDLRSRLFTHFLATQPSRLQEGGLGDALSRLTHDAGKIRTAVGAAVTVLQRPLTALAVAAAAIVMAPKLAGWAAVGLPLVGLVIVVSGRLTREASRDQHARLGDLTAQARDALDGIRTIQAYGAESVSQDDFDAVNKAEIRAGLRTSVFRMAGPPAVEFSAALGVACVLWIGALQVQAGVLTTGALVAFLLALGLLSEPLKGLAVATGLWEEAKGGLERVHETLTLADPGAPSGSPLNSPKLHPHQPAEAEEDERSTDLPLAPPIQIQLRRLGVERGGVPVLSDIDLCLAAGDRVVIQGPSGAGKSTLLDCIAGFVTASSGDILWNGHPDHSLSLAERRASMALVDQQPWLGIGTVGDAIRIGRNGASCEEVQQAAEAAGLTLALDRPVGDGGLPVSGGERQRIALARALLRDAQILLLDEPCSQLDASSERLFFERLAAVAGDRAILCVTHRPAALAFATEVYDLSEGQLVLRSGSLQALA